MRRTLVVVLSVLLLASIVFACGFQSSRISWQRFYRAQGWQLPGVATGELSPSTKNSILGLTAKEVRLDPSGIIEFPATEFNLDGQKRKMPAQPMKTVSLTRWELEGTERVVAYTYDMAPVEAQREEGKWVTSSIAQCTFQATFIDDRGDGIFRLMLTQPMRAELIPAWAHRTKS